MVVDGPKLDVMSLRTMPLSVSTFTPLLPSPGYGPAVSSGIAAHAVLVDAAVEATVAAVLSAVVVLAVDPLEAAMEAELEPESDPHATSTAAAPVPANRVGRRRRLTRVPRSKARPRSRFSSS